MSQNQISRLADWPTQRLRTTRAYLRGCIQDGHPALYDAEEDRLKLLEINAEISRRAAEMLPANVPEILAAWNRITGGKPESKSYVWRALIHSDPAAARWLSEHFDALREAGHFVPKGSYRFGDVKYVVRLARE